MIRARYRPRLVSYLSTVMMGINFFGDGISKVNRQSVKASPEFYRLSSEIGSITL